MTSDLDAGDVPCDLSTAEGPATPIADVSSFAGRSERLILSHAHDRESGILVTGWMDDPLREALTTRHPLGRLCTPTDIAAVDAFLVSTEGTWITGQLLSADGGFSARY